MKQISRVSIWNQPNITVSERWRYITCRSRGNFLCLVRQNCRRRWSFTCEPCSFGSGRTGLFEWDVFEMAAPIQRNAPCIWRGFGSALPFQTHLTQTKPVVPLPNEYGSQVKDQGRLQCCHTKHKNCSYRSTCGVSLLSGRGGIAVWRVTANNWIIGRGEPRVVLKFRGTARC
jgi:hypothetical protein